MDEKPKTWAVSLQDVVSVHVMTSLPIDVRFPDCDFLVRLDPPRRWKRGQKLNRGGRRRARAQHEAKEWIQRALRAAYAEVADEIFETPPSVKWLESIFPEMALDRATGDGLDQLGSLTGAERKDGEK